ncbi:MAG: FAD-dependent oxidoreductase [Hyphomonas sp.]
MVGELTGRKKVLLAGGGHAHILALGHLDPHAADRLDISLISPSPFTHYSGALPGAVAGHWDAMDIRTDVLRLCEEKGIAFQEGALSGIDPDAQQAILSSGERLPYDLLSLDIGSTTRPLDAVHGALAIRPIPAFLDGFTAALEHDELSVSAETYVIAGAGLGGIELALAIRYRLNRNPNTITSKVILLDAAGEILPNGKPPLRKTLRRALADAGIQLRTGVRIAGFADGQVGLEDGTSIPACLLINTTGAASHDWLEASPLETRNGFIEVDACLRSVSHPNVWAAGDVARFTPHPLPPAGVFAVREGPILAENLLHFAAGRDLRPYSPQTDYLKLVSLGGKRAVAEKWGIAISLPGLWHLKKLIDFSFLRAHAFAPRDGQNDLR